MNTLISILRTAEKGLEDGWLYLPKDEEWHANTLGMMIDVDDLELEELDENDEPLIATEKGLISTLDNQTIEDIYVCAKELDATISNEILLESFMYYYEYDAFLPHAGFRPLPAEEYLIQMDREFYDSLGVERDDVQCKSEGCLRGAISGSSLCRIHHFEMIKQKACPFSD